MATKRAKPEPKRSDYPNDDDGAIAFHRAHKRWKKSDDARRAREAKAKAKGREDALILRFLDADNDERIIVLSRAKLWQKEKDENREVAKTELEAAPLPGAPISDEKEIRPAPQGEPPVERYPA